MWNLVEDTTTNLLTYSETEMTQSPVTAIQEASLTHGDFIILISYPLHSNRQAEIKMSS